MLDERRHEHDLRRPHSGPDWRTPAAFAASLTGPSVGAPPFPSGRPADQQQPILSWRFAQQAGGGQ